MRIATQNINWGGEITAPGCTGEARLERLVACLAELQADVVVLTEFKAGPLGEELRGLLDVAGYPHFLSRPQGSFNLGTAIASREQLKAIELPVPSTTQPWRAVGVAIDGFDVFGFYFPLGEAKEMYWDWLLCNAKELQHRNVMLLGDFNTGKRRVDEAGDSFDCQDKHEELERFGFVDTWRAMYPKGRDYTWYSSSGNGFRLDYIWTSPSLATSVRRIWHNHEVRLRLLSDHSTVVADFSPPAIEPLRLDQRLAPKEWPVDGHRLGRYYA